LQGVMLVRRGQTVALVAQSVPGNGDYPLRAAMAAPAADLSTRFGVG